MPISDYAQHNDRLSTNNVFVLDGSVCFLSLVRSEFQGVHLRRPISALLFLGLLSFRRV